MAPSYDNKTAVVVLPALSRLDDPALGRWLARADFEDEGHRRELLASILEEIGVECPADGLGALRMWGQTGDRPTVWIAGADPVYLEPQLDRLCLHALSRNDVRPAELRLLIDHLQSTLAADTGFGFARLGSSGYLRSEKPIATAAVPAFVVDQQPPDDFLPRGDDAAEFRRLQSEIEMSLHDHEVNQRRVAGGKPPVNALWLWGGGFAPQRETRPLPPLFANDPLLHGFWECANAAADLWPDSIDECLDKADGGFVSVAPLDQDEPAFLADCLSALRLALQSGQLERLVLLFRGGGRADVRRWHALRFWRRRLPRSQST